jgi:hypothetical protein
MILKYFSKNISRIYFKNYSLKAITKAIKKHANMAYVILCLKRS